MARKNSFLSTLLSTFFVVLAVMGVASLFTRSVPSSKNCEHEWDEGTIKVEATCSSPGSLVYECEFCGETKKSEIPIVEHLDADMDLACDYCSLSLYQKMASGERLDFGTYRVFRTSEVQSFDLQVLCFLDKYELDGEISYNSTNFWLTVCIPALSSENGVDVGMDISGQDVLTINIFDNYVDFVFKDGDGQIVNNYGDIKLCAASASPSFNTIMDPVEFYKVLY